MTEFDISHWIAFLNTLESMRLYQHSTSRKITRVSICLCILFILFELPRFPEFVQRGRLTEKAWKASARLLASQTVIPNTNIPKIIHQTWKTKNIWQKKDVPSHVRRSISNWYTRNPDYVYFLWDDADMDDMVKKIYPKLYPFYKNLPKIVMKSDLFRLLALKAFGGIVSLFGVW